MRRWPLGGIDYAGEVLERALRDDRATEIVSRLTTVIENRPFAFLRRSSPDRIATFLQHESPQTIALVVAPPKRPDGRAGAHSVALRRPG